ncbi:MAG TPA: DUF4325 domain-containing protein [Nostocaceae cyanobacterium]|nr:DUF4325 domain-containing protein [Nostocaceae cyanobacterium]
MMKVRKRGEEIRHFILENVENHPKDIANLTAEKFGITRQAVNKHIQFLVKQNSLTVEGSTKNKQYKLHPLVEFLELYQIAENLQEDVVWEKDIKSFFKELPANVRSIWYYGFTEMFNNAIEHSSGTEIIVQVQKTANDTEIIIKDNGEGIFNKIQKALNLQDERHSVLELAKGKLTTDPERHTGEGIFFTSRMFDFFSILSGSVFFAHKFDNEEDWIIENHEQRSGTAIILTLDNNTARTSAQIFSKFSTGDDFAFTKTVVPVNLAQYGDEQLISRSQARRMLARIDRFKSVIFDFSGVEAIGQAFADEIFRVFKKQHPEIEISTINTNHNVKQMISRAENVN